ncbi:calcium-binding protein [Noviherbaspirillum sp. Root189]|uniref:calcium-binding protein n=1 Tax=Noviherbaspirillum sp. Root189 TaxID=1736487 RepID=UPI00070B70FB|nr:hypothetical protein [Noviherbaspirillum sp. Root189]KRB77650.1 hypothetical protein ASE07_26245 [Noviherbaspirillum sp. Root189]
MHSLNVSITGGAGNDVLTGNAGKDTINGGVGNDQIDGGANSDTLNGGEGNDTVTGGAGNDTLTGGAGNDIFVFATKADTQGALFAATNTNNSNIDKIVDFVGNGAAAGDTINLGGGAAAFGTAITFTNATTATVTAVTVATAADFTSLAAGAEVVSAGVASTSAAARIYDVTVTEGAMVGRYLIISDETAAITAADTIINITGVSGALNAQDFTFA